MNLRSSDVLVGGAIASVFFGLPSGPTTCPKNVIVVLLYSHFSVSHGLSHGLSQYISRLSPGFCRVPLGCSSWVPNCESMAYRFFSL